MNRQPFHRRSKQWMRIFHAVGLLAAILCAGCFPGALGEPPPGPVYYTFDYESPPPPPVAPVAAVVCVEQFAVSPDYRGEAMVFADARYSRGQYVYHRWRSSPGELVSAFLARDARRSGLFGGVFSGGCRSGIQYRIEGLVEEMFEKTEAGQWTAVLTVTISLVDVRQSDPSLGLLLQKTYHGIHACEDRTPRSIAAAMSAAMGQISTGVIEDVAGRLGKP